MQITVDQAFPVALFLQRQGRFSEAGQLLVQAYRVAPEPLFLFEAAGIHAADDAFESAASLLELIRAQHPAFEPAERFLRVVEHVRSEKGPVWVGPPESRARFEITGQNWEIESIWLEGRFYEPAEIEAIAVRIEPGKTFVDVGANAGNHTVYVARSRPDVKVVPVEPEPRAVTTLARNVELNELTNIDPRFLGHAVSASGGPIRLQFRSSSSSTRRSPDETGIEVPTVPLTELLGPEVGFLKIDVEGMEVECLESAVGTIREHRIPVMIELLEANRDSIEAFIARHGFRIIERIPMHAGENIIVE